jgi:MFS family permease
VLLLGLVSLFADMTYEGARSAAGPYLALLGASATAVGFIAGFGELIGYGFRLVSGFVSDRTGRYWPVTLWGYGLNLMAVPLLALTHRWELAALLIVLERLGKGIRTPARDTMLSHATTSVGRGWGFGLHEAMDQTGAVLGPLIVAGVLFLGGSYRTGFALLAIPAVLALWVLLVARSAYPQPRALEVSPPKLETAGFGRQFWLYLAAVSLVAAGFTDFALIAFHFQKQSVVPADWIPVIYAAAMAADAVGALIMGRLFDRFGLLVLAVVSLLSALFAPLVFLYGLSAAFVGTALWGLGIGAQESIMRAAVANMVSAERRGTAYGIFNAGYGVSWFVGSALMGILYDISIPLLVSFSIVAELASIPLFIIVHRWIQGGDSGLPQSRLTP